MDNNNKKTDYGIMNYWASWNYGAILTCFALQEIVKNLGYSVKVINFRPKVWNNRRQYPCNSQKIAFVEKYFNLTKQCKNKKDLKLLNDIFSGFIVGSDQVWRWGYTLKNLYFLDFVENEKKKIACSVSMVYEQFNHEDNIKTVIEYYMKRFDAISVREIGAVDFCKKEFNVDTDFILDPVFLYDKQNYIKLCNNSKIKNVQDYIALYIFEYNNEIDIFIKKLAQKYNCSIVRMNKGESIEDWLNIIKNAKFVITDSYHGTCFSIIFEKQFISLCNTHGNSRFHSLFSLLNLQDRLFENACDTDNMIAKLEENADYIHINKILEDEIEKSTDWLKCALKQPKNKFKESVESRMLSILLEHGELPKQPPYYKRAIKKIKRILMNLRGRNV